MDSLTIHNTGADFVATLERDADQYIPMPACPRCGSASVTLKNTLTPCYRLECGSCGYTGPRTFAPEWDGRAIKTEQDCKRLHLSAQAAALATWPGSPAGEEHDAQHVWRVAMQVAITLCERIYANHASHGSEAAAHAATRCAQEIQSWQEISPRVIAMLLRTTDEAVEEREVLTELAKELEPAL